MDPEWLQDLETDEGGEDESRGRLRIPRPAPSPDLRFGGLFSDASMHLPRDEPRGKGQARGMMRSGRLGNTDLSVSRVGFGCSGFGDVFGPTDAPQRLRAVDAALDLGVNFFDTSPYYGLTLSETRLGEALAGRRSRALLSTKCGRYGFAEFDFSAARIRGGLEGSLARLRTDYVDLLLAHDVEFGDERQIVEETIPALRSLQREGKARYIGITGYPVHLLKRIARQAPVDAILTYCRYDLLNQDAGTVLAPFAAEQRIGLISASPLSMGLLTAQGPPDWHPAAKALGRLSDDVARICARHGCEVSDVALRFSLHAPGIDTTLVGAASASQVRAAVEAAETPAPPDLLRAIEERVRQAGLTAWPSGRPENADPEMTAPNSGAPSDAPTS